MLLAPQPVQHLPPIPSDALQTVRGFKGVGVQCRVQGRPLRGRGRPQGLQVGEEADGSQGVGSQVGDAGAECVGENGAHDGVGEFSEGREGEVMAPCVHDEPRGPASYVLVGVGESGQRGVCGFGPGPVVGKALEESEDLAAYDGAVGVRELQEPGGDGPGAVGAYRVEDRDAGGIGRRRGGS